VRAAKLLPVYVTLCVLRCEWRGKAVWQARAGAWETLSMMDTYYITVVVNFLNFGVLKVIGSLVRCAHVHTQDPWVFRLCQSSGTLATRKNNVSETGRVSILRVRGRETPTLLGPLGPLKRTPDNEQCPKTQ
jgi:hypothetical protein